MARRTYTLRIPPQVVMTLLGNWRYQQCLALPYLERCADPDGNLVNIPKDVEVTDCDYDWYSRSIVLRLCHPSFPETPDGETDPILVYQQITIQALPVQNPGADESEPIIVEVPTP
jgi:hypothetical protein